MHEIFYFSLGPTCMKIFYFSRGPTCMKIFYTKIILRIVIEEKIFISTGSDGRLLSTWAVSN